MSAGADRPDGPTDDRDLEAVASRDAAEAEPAGAPVLESHLAPQLKAVLLAAVLVAAVLLFQALATLILLVLITVLVAIPVSGFAGLLERVRIPRPLGAFLALALGAGLIAELFNLVIPTIVDQLQSLASSTPAMLEDLRSRYVDLVGGQPDGGASQIKGLVNRFLDRPLTVIEPLLSLGLGVVGVVFTAVLVVLVAYYIAVRPQPLLDGIVNLFPPVRRQWALHVMARLRTAWVGWIRGVLADMLISGTLLYIGLTLVGLDYALLFSVFSALLVVIPYFGSVLGGLPPVLLALTDSPERALLVLLVYLAVQQIESNLVIPLVMSQAVRLHPAVIAVGVVAVGALFGPIGLFVAVPVVSTMHILTDELWVRPAERAHGRRPEPAAPVGAEPAPDAPPPEPTIFKRPAEPPAPHPGEGSASV